MAQITNSLSIFNCYWLRHMSKSPSSVQRTITWYCNQSSLADLCDWLSLGNTLSAYTFKHRLHFLTVLEWLKLDDKRYAQYQAALSARTALLQDAVLSNLVDAASVNPRDAFDDDGTPLSPRDMPEALAASIVSYSMSDKGSLNVRFTSRLAATELLGKQLNMFTDKLEVTGKDGGPVETAQVFTLETARRVAFLLAEAEHSQQTNSESKHE